MESKKYDAFNEFENEVKNNVPKVLPDALKQLKEPLTEYINSQSVTKDSLDLLKTDNINLGQVNASNSMENTLTGQGNSQNKQRVLVREMHGGMNMNTSSNQSVNNVNTFTT